MANYRAVASGNWSAGATWGGGAVPPNGAGHSIYSNTFTVTVDINVDVALVTNAASAGTFVGGGTAALGGTFPLNNGVTMTSPITASASANCVSFAGVSPNTATIVGTVTGGGSTAVGVANNSSGTLLVTSAGTNTGRAFANTSSGTLTITGNCTATGGGGSTPLLTNTASGVVNIIGNVVGGSGGGSYGVYNVSNGAVNITGNVTGGSAAQGVVNASSGLITIVGNVTAGASQLAVSSTTATVRISGSFIYAIDGFAPVYAPRIILSTTPTLAKTRYALNGAGTYVDMFTTDNSFGQASISDVRFGTVYASGTLTGVAYIPDAGSVAAGVLVGSGGVTGTATLTEANVRAAMGLATANLDTQLAAIPTAITNAAAVWDELMSSHTTDGTYGGRVVRSTNANNELQLNAQNHAAANVHQFQAAVIESVAFATSAVTLFTGAMRTELTPELTEITEVHAIHGLDIANALTVTPTLRSAGAITQAITGDGTTSTIVTRV